MFFAAASPPPPPPSPVYYLALGDSLSQGFQPRPGRPGPGRDTSAGYPDVVAGRLKAAGRPVRLVKLGCPGETTTTMMQGGICYRGGRSQLAAATRFLRTHPGRVALVTVDIGINDVVRCEVAAPSPRSAACLGRGLGSVRRNLPVILGRLRSSLGRSAPLVALDYYAPFVEAGASHAAWSDLVTDRLNMLIAGLSGPPGARLARVAPRFGVGLPLAGQVASVCRLTWVCSPPPVGANLHADAAGYRAMADAVGEALAPDPVLTSGPTRRGPTAVGGRRRLQGHHEMTMQRPGTTDRLRAVW